MMMYIMLLVVLKWLFLKHNILKVNGNSRMPKENNNCNLYSILPYYSKVLNAQNRPSDIIQFMNNIGQII